jgi:hypothetical protein
MEETTEWAWNKQDDIKINLREIRCEDVDWIQLANDRICEYCAEYRGFYKTSENVLLGWLPNFWGLVTVSAVILILLTHCLGMLPAIVKQPRVPTSLSLVWHVRIFHVVRGRLEIMQPQPPSLLKSLSPLTYILNRITGG